MTTQIVGERPGIGSVSESGMSEDSRRAFVVGGRWLSNLADPEAQLELEAAHAERIRPLCPCRPGGVAMYVANVGAGRYVVKRMPDTGLSHSPRCPSYLPPVTLSGLGRVLGSTIKEHEDAAFVVLRLGFPMSRIDHRARRGVDLCRFGVSGPAEESRLSLRALLHYLWQEAGLASWSPGMAGKRNWGVVSWHLQAAARGKLANNLPLTSRLYIPEPFRVNRKAAIAARRLSAWAPLRKPGTGHRLMILIGELKAIEPTRVGHRLVIKHLPDTPLLVDEARLNVWQRRFGDELGLWRANVDGHLIAIATFSLSNRGLAFVEDLSMVMTDARWLPYESVEAKLLLDTAVSQGRRFTTSLRYNLAPERPMSCLVLTDTEPPTVAHVRRGGDSDCLEEPLTAPGMNTWTWVTSEEMPALPGPAIRR